MTSERDSRTPEHQSTTLLMETVAKTFLRSLPFSTPASGLYDLVVEIGRSRTTLGQKVQRASAALSDASALVAELEQALNDRVAQVERIREEYERYSKLAEIEEEKSGALVRQLQLALDRGKGRERVISLLLNVTAGIVVFVLGVLSGPWLKSLVGLSQ